MHSRLTLCVSVLELLVCAAGLSGCFSSGDRTVEGQKPAKGSLCKQYCDSAEESGCSVSSSCEEDCQAELRAAPECVALGDAYYGCAAGRDIPCDASGTPGVPSACTRQASELFDCLDGPGMPGDCSAADQCVNACYDQYPGAITLLQVEFECKCTTGTCLDACYAYCTDETVLDRNASCDACWQGAQACDTQALDACNADPECVQGVRCVNACPPCN